MVEEEPVAPAAEEDLSLVVAATEVLAWVAGVGPLWTSLQSFSPQLRRQSRRTCRALQPSPQRQLRYVWRLMTVGKAYPQSCEYTSATSMA